ncbi:MAG: hypothetical protein QOJ32_34, partial [Frankiaceae bacterium]|nr:hypothetical protein [Frankiaceae bacterium]
LFLNETLAGRQWLGIACVVVASVAATLSARQSPVPATP